MAKCSPLREWNIKGSVMNFENICGIGRTDKLNRQSSSHIILAMAIILSIIFALVLAPSNAFANYTVKKDFNNPKSSGYAEQHFALKGKNNNLPLSKAKIDLSCKKSGALKWHATTRWNGWLKETLTGVCAITNDLTSSDKVTIRWKKWALDQYGRSLDFVMIITDFKVSHGRDSYYPIIANFKGGDDQRLIFATPVHESGKSNGYISGLGFTVTAKFVLPDTNTTVPGSYTMSFIDIDFQDYLNNKKAGTTWAEQIIASESQSSDKIAHLHSSTWLSESAASNGKFHNSHSVGSNKWHADSDEDERKEMVGIEGLVNICLRVRYFEAILNLEVYITEYPGCS